MDESRTLRGTLQFINLQNRVERARMMSVGLFARVVADLAADEVLPRSGPVFFPTFNFGRHDREDVFRRAQQLDEVKLTFFSHLVVVRPVVEGAKGEIVAGVEAVHVVHEPTADEKRIAFLSLEERNHKDVVLDEEGKVLPLATAVQHFAKCIQTAMLSSGLSFRKDT